MARNLHSQRHRTLRITGRCHMDQKKELIADMGIEMVHFDHSDKLERQYVVPLGLYLHDSDLSDSERAMARTLAAVKAEF